MVENAFIMNNEEKVKKHLAVKSLSVFYGAPLNTLKYFLAKCYFLLLFNIHEKCVDIVKKCDSLL